MFIEERFEGEKREERKGGEKGGYERKREQNSS